MLAASESPSVSLCMIVRNEALTLPECIASARPAVDEIIVADTGSTDDTPLVASRLGAYVMAIPWTDDFAAARNASLALARGEWVLVLDADERLALESALSLKRVLHSTPATGLRVCVRSLLPPGDVQRYEDMSIVRVFRNRPEHRFRYAIHEQIGPAILEAGGTIEDSGLLILHHGYEQKTDSAGVTRAVRNLALLEEMLRAAPLDPYVHFQLGVTYKAVEQVDLAERHLRLALAFDHGDLSPDVHVRLLTRLAQLALRNGQTGEAVTRSKQALSYQAHNLVAHYVAGVALAASANFAAALPHFHALRYHCSTDPADHADLEAMLALCTTAPAVPTAL